MFKRSPFVPSKDTWSNNGLEIADSAASVGLGYDAVTETWGFRSLPVGVPYNAFGVGNAMSRSYF